MVASIPHALARIKEGWDREFSDEVVAEACIQNGHTWRDRLFSPMFTIRVFLLRVVADQQLPFVLTVPNADTRAAMAEADAIARARRARFETAAALFDALEKTRSE